MRALIVGAGASGLAMAHALHSVGWQVSVHDRMSAPQRGGFMIDFFGPGYTAAEELGVLEPMRARGKVFERVVYLDPVDRVTAALDVDRLVAAAGGRYFSILRPAVTEALSAVLPEGVSIHYGHTLTGVSQDSSSVTAHFTDDSTLCADLLIGSDGVHSRVREVLWGPEEVHLRQLGYRAAAYTIADPPLARRLGATGVLTDSINAQVGMYAVDHVGVATLLVERTDDVDRPPDPAAHWRARLGGLSGLSDRALAQIPDQMYLDTVAQAVVPAWRHGRVLLAGDAAHCVSFLAGQGVSMAIRGAQVLAQSLRGVHGAAGLGSALDSYERRFRPEVEAVQRTGRLAAATFCPRSRIERRLRRVALRVFGSRVFTRLAGRTLRGRIVG